MDWCFIEPLANTKAHLKFEILKKRTDLTKKNFKTQKRISVKTNAALKSLTYVGSLKNHVTIWALLQTPSGQVVHAQKGDYLGKEGALIQSISETAISLKTRNGQWLIVLKTHK